MRLSELFESRDKKKRLSHVKNLIGLALSDGNFDKGEMNFVSRIAASAGIQPGEIERIMKRPESISFFPPENQQERVEQLYDLVMLMMVDGEFHENEIAFCKLVAIELGFKHQIIEEIVDKTIEMILAGVASEIAVNRLKDFIG
jgi:uncharacterized tellurite resistance protein B-like protein